MTEVERRGVPAADAGPLPECECGCGLPMRWNRDSRSRAGGYWVCRAKSREARREATKRWKAANPERDRELKRRWRERQPTKKYPDVAVETGFEDSWVPLARGVVHPKTGGESAGVTTPATPLRARL